MIATVEMKKFLKEKIVMKTINQKRRYVTNINDKNA